MPGAAPPPQSLPGARRQLPGPGAADASGEPPLLIATRLGDLDLVDALLTHGAAVDARDLLRMRASGRLFLGINDDHLADNSGSLRVVIAY